MISGFGAGPSVGATRFWPAAPVEGAAVDCGSERTASSPSWLALLAVMPWPASRCAQQPARLRRAHDRSAAKVGEPTAAACAVVIDRAVPFQHERTMLMDTGYGEVQQCLQQRLKAAVGLTRNAQFLDRRINQLLRLIQQRARDACRGLAPIASASLPANAARRQQHERAVPHVLHHLVHQVGVHMQH
eukprot:363328-Chlamydomonas_euryale.AAC.5